jgi:mRNA interferase RelE/StbE
MAYRVILMPQVEEDLASLDRLVAQRIITKMFWLAENFESLVPEPLSGPLRGLFKLRVGSYRAIYSVNLTERVIIVHAVGHRRDIYR